MTPVVVQLPALPALVDQLWHVLLDLGERLRVPWTVVGGQMVLLHALEHGRVPPQVSQDGDVIADVRARTDAVAAVVAALQACGFSLDGISPDGLAHRYSRQADPSAVKMDVLAPDGLGPRTKLTTTPPGRTVEVPGGTQALDRTEFIDVVHEDRMGKVPRPSLLAAMACKAAACALPGDPSRHLRDLALLCALVPDPFRLREELTRKDRRRLHMAGALLDDRHAAWQLVPSDIREQGRQALALLT